MIRDNREYRSFNIERREKSEDEEKSFLVRGYASTFEPYVLFEDDGIEYFEQIDSKAFDEADMTDVIFLYNHEGMVFARQKNGTLTLSTDERGLLCEADLSSTAESRSLYEAIESGLVDQMSFAFVVEEDSYNSKTHTRTITRIKKVYDCSAVSIPANPTTDISPATRSRFDGFIEAEKVELLERDRAEKLEARKLELLSRLQKEVVNDESV